MRSWERNPHFYADTLASSLAAQAIFTYAPETERARRVLSKLRQVPRLVQAARDNIKDPPAIYVKVGIDTWRGAMSFIEPICRARFPASTTCTCSATSPTRAPKRSTPSAPTSTDLETDIRPKAKGSFRLGRDRFEQKLRLEEGITLHGRSLLAIATRELEATQEEFRQLAGRLNGGDPMKVWRTAKEKHPQAGTLIATARGATRRAAHLPVAQPGGADARERRRGRGADAGIFPLGLGQHVDAGPVRVEAVARDVLPDRRRSEVGRRAQVGAPARLQPADAVDDFHPRGLPGPLPALPVPAQGGVEGPPLDALRAGVVHRRLGALLRADDDRGRVRPRRSRR